MKRIELLGAVAVLALSACAGSAPPPEPAEPLYSSASADVRDAAGRVVARASATDAGDSIRVQVEAVQLTQGAYGAHVHAAGRCDAPGFESAGPHWNPTDQAHGKDNPQGMHKGDLPNLLVGTDGRGSFEFTIPDTSIGGGRGNELLDGDGAAVVIHARPDDYRTDPSGNSGPRIACGVLR